MRTSWRPYDSYCPPLEKGGEGAGSPGEMSGVQTSSSLLWGPGRELLIIHACRGGSSSQESPPPSKFLFHPLHSPCACIPLMIEGSRIFNPQRPRHSYPSVSFTALLNVAVWPLRALRSLCLKLPLIPLFYPFYRAIILATIAPIKETKVNKKKM